MLLKNIRIIMLLLVAGLISCNTDKKYPGYSETETGIYYKLVEIGENNVKAMPGDVVTMYIKYKTLSDSVFFDGKRKFKLTASPFDGSVDECFLMLSSGDKAEFIINAESFFNKTLETQIPKFLNEGNDMKIEIDMLEIQSDADFQREKERFLSWIEDFGEYEKTLLKQYVEEKKINIAPNDKGMYMINMRSGNGVKVEVGDTIVVNYEGKFLNGKFFDSTIERNEPFKFVYGQQWQVIEGLEDAIGKMEETQKVLVILPSEIAFGKEGSSTGIIPPLTSVLFEVELLQVIKKKV